MIAEIAAANAAFQVIKGALSNGKELYDVAGKASEYFDNKSVIQKKAKRGGNKSELECFMAMEKIREEEEWLKDFMVYAGRADMHGDWLKFQADAKRSRDSATKKAMKERSEFRELMRQTLIWGGLLVTIVPLFVYLLVKGLMNWLK